MTAAPPQNGPYALAGSLAAQGVPPGCRAHGTSRWCREDAEIPRRDRGPVPGPSKRMGMYQPRYHWFLVLGFALPVVLAVVLYALTFLIPVLFPGPPYGD